MVVVTKSEQKAQKILKRFLEENPAPESCFCSLESAKPSCTTVDPETHYICNFKGLSSIGRAIVEIATDASEGELIAFLPEMRELAPQRERYRNLAEAINRVRVYSHGDDVKRCGKVELIPMSSSKMKPYWMVLYSSMRLNIACIAKRHSTSKAMETGLFSCFVTCNPFQVHALRRQFGLMSVGLPGVIQQWESEFPLPIPSENELQKLSCS
ncbi:MAG: hypothetical protein AAF558_08640 [Verrucomicrobiota bacterium]